jgi:hypothetical protein
MVSPAERDEIILGLGRIITVALSVTSAGLFLRLLQSMMKAPHDSSK